MRVRDLRDNGQVQVLALYRVTARDVATGAEIVRFEVADCSQRVLSHMKQFTRQETTEKVESIHSVSLILSSLEVCDL